jgi:hypothetical protein
MLFLGELHLQSLVNLPLGTIIVVIGTHTARFLVRQPCILSNLASGSKRLPIGAGAEEGRISIRHGISLLYLEGNFARLFIRNLTRISVKSHFHEHLAVVVDNFRQFLVGIVTKIVNIGLEPLDTIEVSSFVHGNGVEGGSSGVAHMLTL